MLRFRSLTSLLLAALPFSALAFAALVGGCDSSGGGNGGGTVTVSASRIALASVFFQTPIGPLNSGGVTLRVATGSGAMVNRADMLVPQGMGIITARIEGRAEGGAFVRVEWEAPVQPGTATLRLVVKGEVTDVPLTFEAPPAGIATRNVTTEEQDTHVRPTLLLPGTTETALASLGVRWPTPLTLALSPSAATSLAAPVAVAANTAFTATAALALRMGAGVAPGTTDTLAVSATDASGLLVATGRVIVRATAPLPAGRRIAHVPFARSLWPYADTTGLRSVYRWGSSVYGTFRDLALRADGRVFVGADTLRSGRVPGAFRAVALGGALALDAAGGLWRVTDASGGTQQAQYARFDFPVTPLAPPQGTTWGAAVAVGGGFHTYATDEVLYRSVAGFADGWVRDLTSVGGVQPIGSARLPSAPVVVGATHVSVAAMTADGTVYSFGSNRDGTLGSGGGTDQIATTATVVTGLPPMATLTVGPYYVIGTDRTGGRWGWGLLADIAATAGCPLRTFNERRCAAPVRLP